MIAVSQAEQTFQLAESIAYECRFVRFDNLRKQKVIWRWADTCVSRLWLLSSRHLTASFIGANISSCAARQSSVITTRPASAMSTAATLPKRPMAPSFERRMALLTNARTGPVRTKGRRMRPARPPVSRIVSRTPTCVFDYE